MLKLYVTQIEDQFVQENFKRIQQFTRDEPLVNGNFKFFKITVPGAFTGRRFKHNLGFVPQDVLFLSATNGVIPVWKYDKFDVDFIEFDTSGATVIRAFIGKYLEPQQ